VSKHAGAFAVRLKTLREAAGISQYALAKRSGLSKQALSNLELGAREPTWATVQRLARALGVDCRNFEDPSLVLPEQRLSVRPRGRPPKATPATPPAENLEASAMKTRRRPRKKS
jgi:transcriptional regulator with XRE-family HTH domain